MTWPYNKIFISNNKVYIKMIKVCSGIKFEHMYFLHCTFVFVAHERLPHTNTTDLVKAFCEFLKLWSCLRQKDNQVTMNMLNPKYTVEVTQIDLKYKLITLHSGTAQSRQILHFH